MPNALRRGIRSLIRTETVNPPSGQRLLYPKSDGWYDRDSAGVETNLNLSGSGGGGGGIPATLLDAKGDLIVATAADTAARLPAGFDGQIPMADSTATEGLRYVSHIGASAAALPSVKAATTANITLQDAQTIDGVLVDFGDVVLVKDQTTASQNGIYLVAGGAGNPWTRHHLFDSAYDLAGITVRVHQGTANGGKIYATDFKSTDSVGTTNMDWDVVQTGAVGSAATLTATTDYTNTTPTAPTTGVRIFSRHNARRLPAIVGPTGLDTSLQPALFSNRVARMNAVNNATTPSVDGIALTHLNNATSTPTSVLNASSSFYNSMVRYRCATTTTAGTGASARVSVAQWFTSATANMGGFFAVFRCGMNAITATMRGFVGLSATGAALSPTANPSTLFNLVGFGYDSAQTTWRLMHNDGTGAATTVDLGANFPVRAATDFYEFRLFAPSGSGNTIYWSAKRLNDGALAQGGPITTDLPAVGTLLTTHFHISNGTTAAAASMDIQSLYVETDN